MKMAYLFIAMIIVFCGCNHISSKDKYENTVSKLQDSITKRKAIDAQMAAGERPDSEQEGPTGQEVLQETLERYNKIKKTDTLIIDGKDSLSIHLRYYCLHDSTLIVPARYDWWEETKKDFTTHNFAAKIWILKNQDTIFNNVITKNWFRRLIPDDNQKKYSTFINAGFSRYEQVRKEIVFGFSISIPMTDVGIGANLVVDKNGGYQLFNN